MTTWRGRVVGWIAGGVVLVGALLHEGAATADDPSWEILKGKHFIVYSTDGVSRDVPAKTLRRAESYYKNLGDRIGYTRYSNFWLGDDRVRIIVFADKEEYARITGQPVWSSGYADRDAQLFRSRTIVTYEKQRYFFDGLLPHEISHLVLHDFIGDLKAIPIWFDEGVAQLMEEAKMAKVNDVMRRRVKAGQYIPLPVLHRLDIRKEEEPQRVQLFYAQSLSVVDFLIRKYGSADFGRLCRNLRDTKDFETALRSTYVNQLDSMDDLEVKWTAGLSH